MFRLLLFDLYEGLSWAENVTPFQGAVNGEEHKHESAD
jgi:hypothetical protein